MKHTHWEFHAEMKLNLVVHGAGLKRCSEIIEKALGQQIRRHFGPELRHFLGTKYPELGRFLVEPESGPVFGKHHRWLGSHWSEMTLCLEVSAET